MAACLSICVLITTGFSYESGDPLPAAAGGVTPGALPARASVVDPRTFISAESVDPATLDPAITSDSASGQVIHNIYETLVFYAGPRSDDMLPMLADSYIIRLHTLLFIHFMVAGLLVKMIV
jgi:ABC-type transport system substrate-binding protein